MKYIEVRKVLDGGDRALLHSQGLHLCELMLSFEAQTICLSFQGVNHCTMAFLNASIGRFILLTNGAKAIRCSDASPDIQMKFDLAEENCRDVRKRDILTEIANSLLQQD